MFVCTLSARIKSLRVIGACGEQHHQFFCSSFLMRLFKYGPENCWCHAWTKQNHGVGLKEAGMWSFNDAGVNVGQGPGTTSEAAAQGSQFTLGGSEDVFKARREPLKVTGG